MPTVTPIHGPALAVTSFTMTNGLVTCAGSGFASLTNNGKPHGCDVKSDTQLTIVASHVASIA